MRIKNNNGYALVAVLGISFALFSLLTLVMSTNHRLHKTNCLLARDLQERADGLGDSER